MTGFFHLPKGFKIHTHLSLPHSFLHLSNIPLHGYTRFHLSSHKLIDIACFTLRLSKIMLAQVHVYNFCGGTYFPSLYIYQGAEKSGSPVSDFMRN